MISMKIKCLKCNDIIESKSVHDCKRCKCGECSIDGGDVYHIISGDFDYIAVVKDDGTEEKINIIKIAGINID